MATVTYTLSGDSVTFAFTPTDTTGLGPEYFIEYTSGTLTGSTSVVQGEQPPYETTISGLTSGQTYTFDWKWKYQSGTPAPLIIEYGTVTVTALDTTPKTATQAQWQDLAARVKAKADASSIPTVNNSTITVTNNGLDKGTFTTNQASAGTVALDYPTITMTTTDPGEGAAIAANNYVAVYGGDPIIMDYSTSEVNTGAKWIDGSAIYKKTINFGALPNATNKTVAHQISNVSRFVKVEQSITNNGGTGALVLSSGQASNNDFNFYVTGTDIGVTTSGDRSTCNAYVTLYYTKSSS